MKLFNPTEETLKIELTPYGKELFSKGKFKPAFYTFSDEDVVYNTNLAPGTPTELQSSGNVRITDQTPHLHPQNIYYSSPIIAGEDAADTEQQTLLFNTARKLQSSLGNMSLSGNAGPAFKITFLQGEVKTTSNFYVSSSNANNGNSLGHYDVPIPQIDVDLEFKTAIASPTAPPFEFDPTLSRQIIHPDGGTAYVQSNQITLIVEETNTTDLFENFDIEVFEIFEDVSEVLGNKELKHLPLVRQQQDLRVENNMLVSKEQMMQERNMIAKLPATPNDTDYYFDVFTDVYDEISEDFICSLISKLRSEGFALDIGFECPDRPNVNNTDFNIYDSDSDIAEKCP